MDKIRKVFCTDLYAIGEFDRYKTGDEKGKIILYHLADAADASLGFQMEGKKTQIVEFVMMHDEKRFAVEILN